MWDGVIGQEQAVGRLRRAVERPSHAYVLAGPRGWGVLEAARCFAAALVCPEGGCGTCNACRRARSVRHPDVIEVEPAGTFVVVDQVEEMMKEAFTSPFEAERKVIVVTEADRMNEPAANKLLKTLEEPPARTHFVLLSESPDELLPTVRSRCQRIDFAALSDADVAAALGAESIQAVLADTLTGLEKAQKAEAKALETELTEAGYPDRLARRLRRDLEQRQQRATRRARTDALAEVVTALEWYYRDALL